jgi:hypothetical protein
MFNTQILLLERQNESLIKRVEFLNSDTSATEENANAQEQLVKSYDSVKTAMDSSLKDIELKTEQMKTAIAEGLASGELTEDTAGTQILNLEKETLEERLAQKLAYLKDMRMLEKSEGNPEELANIQGEIASVELESQKLRTDIANMGYEQRKEGIEQILKEEADIIKQTNNEIEKAEKQKILTIKQAQLEGVISTEEAQKRIKQVSLDSISAQIKAQKEELTSKADLLARGLITVGEYEASETEILTRLTDLRSQGVDAQIALQEEANRVTKKLREEELKEIIQANNEAQRAIERSINSQITALKNKKLQGIVTEDEFQKQLAIIQSQGTNRNIENTKRELNQLEGLKSRQLITEEDFYNKKITLENELAGLINQKIDQQLEAQKRAVEEAVKLIEERANFEIGKLEDIIFAEEQRSNALKSQADLLNAQLGLQTAQANLEQQRLQFAIEGATTEGEKFALEQRLQDLKEKNLIKNQQVELQILNIKQQQALIEAQRQKTLADISVLEAEAAIASARARGASASELSALQKILDLKRQIAVSADEQSHNNNN